VASTVLLAPASASAQADLHFPSDVLVASVATVGVVNLSYIAPAGSQVAFNERVGNRLKTLGVSIAKGTDPPVAVLLQAVRWRCDRVVRRFEATATARDGTRTQDTYDVRTPSCADRLTLSVPRRAARGALVRIRAKDRWLNGGIKPRLCITPPHGAKSCRALAFPRAIELAGQAFRPRKRGEWRIDLSLNGHHVRAKLAVGGGHADSSKALPTVLATGDSQIQGIDSFLADRLADTASVRSKVYGGTGLSRAQEWLTRATLQVKSYRPRATVILVGDAGFAMPGADGATHECCDALWAAEYERRVRTMMKTYIRHGKGRVVWATSPTPKNAEVAAITSVINAAVLRAAEGRAGAKVVRLDALFTPSGFRETMPYRGQTVRVRQSDGVHLTTAGAAIAAEAIEKALR